MRQPRKVQRRTAVIAFSASVAVHAVALSWRLSEPDAIPTRAPSRAGRRVTFAPRPLEVIRLATIAGDLPASPLRPRSPVGTAGGATPGNGGSAQPDERAERGAVAAGPDTEPSRIVPSPPERRAARGGPGSAAPTGLAPALGEADLWRALVPDPDDGPSWGRERHALLRAIADALAEAEAAAVAEAAERPGVTTWAWERAGGRWGFSPGRVHLGGVTIPTCGGAGGNLADCGFGIRPGRREEHAAWWRAYREIRLQTVRAGMAEHRAERARAIRRRRDAERAYPTGRRPSGGGAGLVSGAS